MKVCESIALLKYFKRIDRPDNEESESILPEKNDTLSLLMPSSSIVVANSEVRKVMKENGGTGS